MDSEATLWQECRKGSKRAFTDLFVLYHKALFAYGTKIMNNREVVEDTIQELFIELWQGIEKLNEVTSFKAYLFKSLKYKLFRLYKQQLQMLPIKEDEETLVEFSYEAVLIATQTDYELKERLKTHIQSLTKRQQEAIYLRFFNQMEYEEISEVMSITYQGAINLIYQAIKTLREKK